MFPTATSLALDPMGALAGTAAAAMGATISYLGAFLASLIDRSIDGTVTPVAVGFLVYSSAALAFQLAGRRALGKVEAS
jgi:DHA1 family bicyclomycin/chloramphenicol resistance-like MFS transporter